MKTCKQCFLNKNFSDFYKEKTRKDGYRPYCKECISKNNKVYGEKNKEKISIYNKNRKFSEEQIEQRKQKLRLKYQQNKELFKQKREKLKEKLGNFLIEYKKQWYLKNKEKCNKKSIERYKKNKDKVNKQNIERSKNDIQYKLRNALRKRMSKFLKNKLKNGSAVKDLGCSIDFLKTYLESKFLDGMTWENYGTKGWHIDHIRPLSKFDLTDKDQFKQACHYTNLQPLWWYDNINKRDIDFCDWIKLKK